MTPLFPAQRAAEDFDQVLGGTASPAVARRYADLLDTVTAMRTRPEVLPRADFVGDLRSRLMTAAATELVAAPAVVRHLPPPSSRNRRRFGTVAAALVIVGGSAGMAAAASGSLPGEALYPIKRGVEQVGTAVRVGDVSKGNALLDQAATRLDEVGALQAEGSRDSALITTTVDSFNSAADAGSEKLFAAYAESGDTKPIITVRAFTAQQMADLADLSGTSASTDEVLLDAADTLADIDLRARALCGVCGPRATLAPPGALSAGAGAATVENLLSRPVSQAQLDIDQTEAVRLARLKAAAEESAGTIPKPDALTDAGTASGLPTASTQDAQVTSTITSDGRLVPSPSSGAAVKDLVSGVTGSVKDVPTKVTPGKTPIDPTVKGLTDTLDKTSDDRLP